MNVPRPWTKIGTIFLGLAAALVIAWIAVEIRQHATQGPDAQASAGMYAFGDFVLGMAVFGVVALVPLGLTLYWLRPVALFWSILLWSAMLFAIAGVMALAANVWTRNPTSNWMLLTHARIGLMPLSALAMLLCALFAPRARHRWLLLAAALSDGAIFTGIVLIKFILPNLNGR